MQQFGAVAQVAGSMHSTSRLIATKESGPSLRLQVASDGEIVWVFPSGFEATIASKSWRLRAEPAFKGERAAGHSGSQVMGVSTLVCARLTLLRVHSRTVYFVQ